MQTVKKTGGVFRTATVLLLCCFFLLFVICPLGAMLLNLGKADLGALLRDGSIRTTAGHSLLVSLCATVISIAVAAVAAVCVSRTAVRLKSFFSVLILLPMLIPSISHGMGLTILFGQNGTLTKLLGMQNGIYGFSGIVVGSVMYAFPVAFLMICDILRYEDATPYEAARVLGIGKARRFCAITLPYLTKPMISVFFAVFTMIITDYGVPLMIGGKYKTLPVLMYEEVIGRQDFAKGSFFGVILLLPAVIAFFVDLFCKNDRRSGSVAREFTLSKKFVRDCLCVSCGAFRLRDLSDRFFCGACLHQGISDRSDLHAAPCAEYLPQGRGRLSAQFRAHCLRNCAARHGNGISQRLLHGARPCTRLPLFAPDVHFVACRSGHCVGAFLCAVFQRDVSLRNAGNSDSCQYDPLFLFSVSDDVQQHCKAQPESGGGCRNTRYQKGAFDF